MTFETPWRPLHVVCLKWNVSSRISELANVRPLNAGSLRMPRSTIERIRDKIRQRQYDMAGHTMEEMAEGDLDIVDVEHSILGDSLVRIDRDDYALHS